MEIQADYRADWTIGRLAELSGVPVKTIRFYSDAGLLPAHRTPSGHRRYGPGDLARLQLLRSLRALDLDLPTIARILAGSVDEQQSLRTSLAAHTRVLEHRLREVRRQLAVARAASEAPAHRTLARLQSLARIEAAERERLLDRFWDDVLVDAVDPDVAARFREFGTPELPDEPTGEQLDAWLELAELAADADFRRTTRENGAWFWQQARPDLDMAAWQRRVAQALELAADSVRRTLSPASSSAHPAVDRWCAAYADAFGRPDTADFRRWLVAEIAARTDPRAERWWQLVATVDPAAVAGQEQQNWRAVQWLHDALASLAADPTPGSRRALNKKRRESGGQPARSASADGDAGSAAGVRPGGR